MDLSHELRSVIPTVDADVLQVLAGGDVSLTGREVHRLVGTRAYESVRRTLDRLVREGIVERRHAGRSHLFSLNHDHLAANAIKQLAHLRYELFDRIRLMVDAWSIHPTTVALFGSTARADSGSLSDLDVFVLRPFALDPDDTTWTTQLMDLEQAAHRWTGNDVRILEFSEAEIDELLHERVLHDIARDGIELFGTLAPLRRALRQAP